MAMNWPHLYRQGDKANALRLVRVSGFVIKRNNEKVPKTSPRHGLA